MAKCKDKGTQFEREICKQISLWWTENERDDIFWRSSNSGGRATVRDRQSKQTFGQYGDVQATDPIGQPLIDLCTIEIKRGYGNASVGDVVDKSPTAAEQKWEKFVMQAKGDAEKAGSVAWLLITKRDRRDTMCFFPTALFRPLMHTAKCSLLFSRPFMRLSLILNEKEERIFGTPFSQFMKYVTPDDIKVCL